MSKDGFVDIMDIAVIRNPTQYLVHIKSSITKQEQHREKMRFTIISVQKNLLEVGADSEKYLNDVNNIKRKII